ncbi:glutamine cyclotransferase [Desulfovibrio sp. X2]|uniref:glutaminyl-peptide cyclotransferase n=1 Tax=Desulfovibrio sp. X2 TaxID=941449 RepID=UPI0003589D8B|nr:glutaminyl-peptide cyclotransferase [Desulfovibrio sp. X2]EPR40252.1 glutamine cyclotransferase [Desulfovibrio sp. X2]
MATAEHTKELRSGEGEPHGLRAALRLVVLLLALAALPGQACAAGNAGDAGKAGNGRAPVHAARILQTRPHDDTAFTEGLFFANGTLIESTGRYGFSELRRVDPATGRVLSRAVLPRDLFGEGAAPLPDGRIVQLTWKARRALVRDQKSFAVEREFSYRGEGWGLTTDGRRLIMSNGSARLTFRDPATFAPLGDVLVTDGGEPVQGLNELEYVRGLVLANVWLTADVVAVDPATGRVRWRLDLSEAWRRSGLAGSADAPEQRFVPNGLAYDAGDGALWVTGKCWPVIFRVALPDDFPRP